MASKTCTTCGVEFPSKTKLFGHLKTKQVDGSLSDCNKVASEGGVTLRDHPNTNTNQRILLFVAWTRRSEMLDMLRQYLKAEAVDIPNTCCGVNPTYCTAAAASVDCFVIPLKQFVCPPETIVNITNADKSFHIYGVTPPVPHYYNLSTRCYRREISILLPLAVFLPGDASADDPQRIFADMNKRQELRDLKQKMHRDADFCTKENKELFESETKRTETTTKASLLLFQQMKKVCKSFCGVWDFASFIDDGLPNNRGTCVREIISYQILVNCTRWGHLMQSLSN